MLAFLLCAWATLCALCEVCAPTTVSGMLLLDMWRPTTQLRMFDLPDTRVIQPCCFPCPAQVQGGGLRDSFLVDGVAFKKTFSYAGFEMQPRSFTDPPILLLNIELELKAEKENAEVRRLCLSRSASQ